MAERIVVAMSGGVDSSVAALLLKEQGHEVIGVTLKTWPKGLCDTVPKGQTCCSARDVEDARLVAARLGIPFYVVEASEPFRARVIDYFVQGYREGLTPNPCVVCNRQIKCGILLEKAGALGARRLATGHYAGVEWSQEKGRYLIRQAVDGSKDQSYVLFQLTQEQLARMVLPLAGRMKEEVRALAAEAGLPVADKPESMELCFIPDGNTRGFLRQRAPEGFEQGEIVGRGGRVLGTHQGIAGYTVGQRRGLGIASPRPLYVIMLDKEHNRIVVGEEGDMAVSSCEVADLHWVALSGLQGPTEASVKIRYRSEKLSARLVPEGERVRVEFQEPVACGVSPGQAAVFYDGDLVLGGGWITRPAATGQPLS